MKDLWSRMNPALAGLLRGLGLAVAGAVLVGLTDYLATVQAPDGAPMYVGLLILALRAGVDGLYDLYREKTGKSVERPEPPRDPNLRV